MANDRKAKQRKDHARWGDHDHKGFILQGGGALGAYQAGVYAGLEETGESPDWIAGVSIGAINAALIAGNPPERRVERLREFWEGVSSQSPLILPSVLDSMRPMFNRASAASAMTIARRVSATIDDYGSATPHLAQPRPPMLRPVAAL